MSDPARGAGLFTSIQRLMATAIEMVHVRLELLGTEVELEKRRLFDGLLFGGVALLLLGMGLILLCGFIVLMFEQGYRLAAVGVMAVLFLGGGALTMHQARRRLRNPKSMFEVSLQELAKDHAGLSGHNPP